MKEIKYGQLLKESFQVYIKNFPQILLYWIVSALIFLTILPVAILAIPVIFIPNLQIQIALFVIIGLIALAGLFILGSMSLSLMIGMTYDLARNKKLKTSNIIPYLKRYWKQVLQISMFIILILLVILILIGALIGITYLIHPLLAAIMTLLAVLLFIGLMILTGIFLIFLQPTIAVKKAKAMDILRETIQYTKSHLSHSVLTWIISAGIGMGISLIAIGITALISAPTVAIYGLESIKTQAIIRTTDGITNVLTSLISIWLGIFIFKSFLKGKSK